LKSETVVANDAARIHFPEIVPAAYAEAFARALDEIEHHQVVSRWCDSAAGAACELNPPERISDAVFRDRKEGRLRGIEAEAVFRTLLSIGGDRGGSPSTGCGASAAGSTSSSEGRASIAADATPAELRIGDGVDFWKVLDLQPGRRLLLLAQMRLPGRAWLEFAIEAIASSRRRTSCPRDSAGGFIWYAMLPATLSSSAGSSAASSLTAGPSPATRTGNDETGAHYRVPAPRIAEDYWRA